jgi:hypothetical protein
MRWLARLSGPALFGLSLAWILLVCFGWLLTPSGQAIIWLVKLVREHPEGVNVALPRPSLWFWAIVLVVVAVLPVIIAAVAWFRIRRSDLGAGRLTSA